MFCDVDDWIFHSLSLCLSPFSVYYCVTSWLFVPWKSCRGGLCHGHISHLVYPKTLLLDTLEHAKKGPENLANNFSSLLWSAIDFQFFLVGWHRQMLLYMTNPTCGNKFHLTNLTSGLDKLTWQVDLSPCPLAPLQITWQVITCQGTVDLSSQLEQSSYQHKCRTLGIFETNETNC